MTNSKIELTELNWELDKPRFFYRGMIQADFEVNVLNNIIKYDKPCFFGCNDADDNLGPITFCSQDYFNGLWFARYQFESSAKRNVGSFFTCFPLIMQINAEKYKDRLLESSKGEGIIIKGLIDLEDITILLSKHVNKLKEFSPLEDYSNKRLINTLNDFFHFYDSQGIFSEKDLLDKFLEDKNSFFNKFHSRGYTFLSKCGYDTNKLNKAIFRFVDVLKQKTR